MMKLIQFPNQSQRVSNNPNTFVLLVFLATLFSCTSNHPTKEIAADATATNLPEATAVPLSIDKGPGMEEFIAHCQTCHTARYVFMQPKLSRAAWEKTVDKMIKVYGAEIDSATSVKIIDYLLARQ
jgi:hypothetical protein